MGAGTAGSMKELVLRKGSVTNQVSKCSEQEAATVTLVPLTTSKSRAPPANKEEILGDHF